MKIEKYPIEPNFNDIVFEKTIQFFIDNYNEFSMKIKRNKSHIILEIPDNNTMWCLFIYGVYELNKTKNN